MIVSLHLHDDHAFAPFNRGPSRDTRSRYANNLTYHWSLLERICRCSACCIQVRGRRPGSSRDQRRRSRLRQRGSCSRCPTSPDRQDGNLDKTERSRSTTPDPCSTWVCPRGGSPRTASVLLAVAGSPGASWLSIPPDWRSWGTLSKPKYPSIVHNARKETNGWSSCNYIVNAIFSKCCSSEKVITAVCILSLLSTAEVLLLPVE